MIKSLIFIHGIYRYIHISLFRWARCGAGMKAVYQKKAAVLKVKQQAEMAKYKAAKAKASGPKRAL